MRALVIIETDSVTDFDAAIRSLRRRECTRVVVLDENWNLSEHENLTQESSTTT